jgi:putative N6-adenine-specific DNA methylase
LAENVTVRNRAVAFEGELESLYTANYMSRTAISVLLRLRSFKLKKAEDLYDKAVTTEWAEVMSADDTFAVVSVSNSPFFSHTGYPALVVKDAIADYFRKACRPRPLLILPIPGY